MNTRPCFAEVNLDRLISNVNEIRQKSKKNVMAVVKANAYGHGAIEVSRSLLECGVDILAVATVEEALELRYVYPDVDILIMGPTPQWQIEECIKNNISIIVSGFSDVSLISEVCDKLQMVAKVHLAIDTGMSRVGYFAQMFDEMDMLEIESMFRISNVSIEGIFTHFASSEDEDLTFTYYQYNIFRSIVSCLLEKGYCFKYIHCQNSAGSLSIDDDICNYVRLGLYMYGYHASANTIGKIDIHPCLEWKCRISHIKQVPSGTPIGYNSTYITEMDTVVATLPLGYADGFRRSFSNGFKVYLENGYSAPTIGRICMDQCMIDVTGAKDCKVGDCVIIMGNESDAETLASAANTISYEILCGISSRVPRIYTGNLAR